MKYLVNSQVEVAGRYMIIGSLGLKLRREVGGRKERQANDRGLGTGGLPQERKPSYLSDSHMPVNSVRIHGCAILRRTENGQCARCSNAPLPPCGCLGLVNVTLCGKARGNVKDGEIGRLSWTVQVVSHKRHHGYPCLWLPNVTSNN